MWRFWRQCGVFQAVCVSLQSVNAAGCLGKQTGDHDTLASVCAGRTDRLPWAAVDFETQSTQRLLIDKSLWYIRNLPIEYKSVLDFYSAAGPLIYYVLAEPILP